MGESPAASPPKPQFLREPQHNSSSAGRQALPEVSLIESASELDSLRGAWDALAVATGSPYAAPAWSMAWWNHLAPAGARLAVVVVRDGEELVGLAPFYLLRRFGVSELRLIGGGWASRLEILASPGREHEVATAITQALGDSDLRPDVFRWQAIDRESPWPTLLDDSDAGAAGHRIQSISERSAPVVEMREESFEDWFAAKSSHFRSHMRRDRRKLEKQGASFRLSDRDNFERDLVQFIRLHSSRRENRGGTAIGNGALAGLQEVGAELIDQGRFRLWMIDGPDGDAISAQLFVSAGSTIAFWNTGFDETWRRYSPGAVALVAAIEDGFEQGSELMDLGGGEASYKDRVATLDRPVAWRTSYRRGYRYPLARIRLLPEQAVRRRSHRLRSQLGADRFNKLRRLLAR